ncbi:MAG: Stealth CR1 domain-containing protein [Muribaculaceae bacterium]|nr:Stealth CR1 domain-containing protein [Muribaculaceae bacterium]
MKDNDLKIDLVYTWVNGNDPEWRKKHDKFTGAPDRGADVDCKGRYADNDELKYSLRSVEKYAPWIRKIFIVTDNQIPEWLNTDDPKIKIVDHKEILPPEALPCFNAQVFEHYLHKIPDLSEHFIYSNDDMFLNREVTPDTFFAPDGMPIIRFLRSPLRGLTIWIKGNMLKKPLSHYNSGMRHASQLVAKKYGRHYHEKSHHNIDAYLKSDFCRTADTFKNDIAPTVVNHIGGDNDIQRMLYSYVPLAEERAHKVYVDKKTSFMLRIHRPSNYKKIIQYNPVFFCMNDSQYADDNDRLRAREYLENRFPEKSRFEKS